MNLRWDRIELEYNLIFFRGALNFMLFIVFLFNFFERLSDLAIHWKRQIISEFFSARLNRKPSPKIELQ